MKKTTMSELEWAAWVFVLIGSINWGLVGLFDFDGVQVVFSTIPTLGRLIYILTGAAGVYWLAKTVGTKR